MQQSGRLEGTGRSARSNPALDNPGNRGAGGVHRVVASFYTYRSHPSVSIACGSSQPGPVGGPALPGSGGHGPPVPRGCGGTRRLPNIVAVYGGMCVKILVIGWLDAVPNRALPYVHDGLLLRRCEGRGADSLGRGVLPRCGAGSLSPHRNQGKHRAGTRSYSESKGPSDVDGPGLQGSKQERGCAEHGPGSVNLPKQYFPWWPHGI